MSLKSELSADRKKKIEERKLAMDRDFVEMPKKIYEQLLEPTFRLMHECHPMVQTLEVEIRRTGSGFKDEILKALCERAEEFELEAHPNKECDDIASFVLKLDD